MITVKGRVTIRSYDTSWEGVEVTGVGKDSFTGVHDVFLIAHPEFGEMEFYAERDEHGCYTQVGNAAFWIEDQL